MRQRVTAAIGEVSAASCACRLRRSTKAVTPALSAASCRRREAVASSRRAACAIGGEADLGQGGREEIGAFRDPEHRAVEAREDAGDHEPGGGRVFQGWPRIGQFMQSAEAQAAFRQMPVDGVDAEGQRGAGGFPGATPLQRRERPA
jgi:hypothetical protein